MGKSVLELLESDERFLLAAALEAADHPQSGECLRLRGKEVRIASTSDSPCDALVDFTLPAGTATWLPICRKRRIPMVIGTTGHDENQLRAIRDAAGEIPIVLASNFSVGIQAVLRALGPLIRDLGDGYDIEIVESHHRNKIDAPSGTAITLAKAIAEARGLDLDNDAIYGRRGKTGVRPAAQLGIHSIRMGEIVGEHEIHLSGPGETITIRHTAHSRATFAAGALRAAAWVVGRPPGLYTMMGVMDGAKQGSVQL